MTMKDQSKKFTKLLINLDMYDENKGIKPNSNISKSEKKEVLDYIEYAYDIDCLDLLDPLPKQFNLRKCEEIFGFEFLNSYSLNSSREYYSYNSSLDEMTNIDISGYDKMSILTNDSISSGLYNSSINPDNKTLNIYQNNDLLIEINLKSWFSKLQEYEKNGDYIPSEKAYLVEENDKIKTTLILDYYRYNYNRDFDTYENINYKFYIFIKDKR